MGFLRYFDYQNYIQNINLQQIIASNDAIRVSVENAAQAEMVTYLVNKYDIPTAFAPTTIFSKPAVIKANSLVELNFPAYVPATVYNAVGIDTVINAGKAYVLKTSGATGTFDPTKWTLLGNQYDLFYLAQPYPTFDLMNGLYKAGNVVFWKDKVYSCLLSTRIQSHDDQLQAGVYANVPPPNIFPDDPVNGVQYWGVGVPYQVSNLTMVDTALAWVAGVYSAGAFVTHSGIIYEAIAPAIATDVPGTGITVWQPVTWVSGDNRNPQLVMYMTRIVVYHISSRLSPNTTPIEIEKRYMGLAEDRIKYKGKIVYPTYSALGWLQECAMVGDTTVDLTQNQPQQGSRISGGSAIKQVNDY